MPPECCHMTSCLDSCDVGHGCGATGSCAAEWCPGDVIVDDVAGLYYKNNSIYINMGTPE